MPKTVANLSLDLDNQWSYMKSGAIDGWQDFPSYLDVAVPRFLDCLDRHGARITVFVVGQDAGLARNADALRCVAGAGHEIASHSYHHEPWLSGAPAAAVRDEIARAHDAIAEATGQAPVGFRGPGFALSMPILAALRDAGYLYDASTFPTFIGPAARAYYFLTSGFTREEREKRAHLYGSLADGLRPLRPYRWRLPGGSLIEMPVTTFPLVRLPFHLSYVSFLAAVSPRLAMAYFRAALVACRAAGIEPSLLLHPLDFLGLEDVPCLGRFPGMRLSAARKLALVDRAIGLYCEMFDVLPMREHYRRVAERRILRDVVPSFAVDRAGRGLTPVTEKP